MGNCAPGDQVLRSLCDHLLRHPGLHTLTWSELMEPPARGLWGQLPLGALPLGPGWGG